MNSRLVSFSQHTPPTVGSSDTCWLLGTSPAAAQVRLQIRRVAPLFRTALLLGEPGSGAEYAARLLHELSPAALKPFCRLSAAEAEIRFRAHPETATEDFIFIPELERLSPVAQAGLLHLLRRRGGHAPRIVAASTRNLRALITAEGFNPDLAYVLGSIHITLPSLRDRSEDIPSLAHCALQLSAIARGIAVPTLSPTFLEEATAFSWPGNVDQLRAVFDWLIEVHRNEPVLYARDLESALAAFSQPDVPPPSAVHGAAPRLIRLDYVVQQHVRTVLSACQGNKLRASEVLGISRSTLYRMLEQNQPGSESVSEMAFAV